MKMQVIGKGIYSGEYQGVQFKKICYTVAVDIPKKFEFYEGSYCEQIIAPFNQENDKIQIGDLIKVYYNKYGKVDAILVDKEK